MDKLVINGGTPLKGEIPISGAKNAALPLLTTCLLSNEPLALSNMPQLADIRTMLKLLQQHGVKVKREGENSYVLNGRDVHNLTAPYDLVRTMRASVLVLGPLLARHGAAKVSLPGGCAIGSRPVDLHLSALEKMGAHIELRDGYIHAEVDGRLKGAEIVFEKVSVGATENILMAATLAEGTTTLRNAAREPEVCDLAQCLNKMGAKINGIGTDELVIEGVEKLHSATHPVIADRIEAGSYAAATAITGGDVTLMGIEIGIMGAIIEKFAAAGIEMTQEGRGIRVRRSGKALKGMDVMTQPYPGFPTDMQAQMMALLALTDGASLITETIFENRYMHVPELARMGADITVHDSSAMIRGVKKLRGADVMATDLRASFSLVIAALAAEGTTTVHRLYHLDRGYEKMEEKLRACGAEVQRMSEKEEADSMLESVV